MKKIILFVLLPLLSFGQVSERAQKQSYRFGGSPSSSFGSYSPNMSSRPSIGEYQQKQIERQRNNQPRGGSGYLTAPGNLWYDPWYDPWWGMGWGWNRWYPFTGWNYFDRFWWYDNWGYRNPGRVYVYSDGKRDTVKAKPLHGSVGISYNKNPEWGLWGTLGREVYVILEYSRSFQRDESAYYSDITKDQVNEWGDKRFENQVRSNLFSLGLGKKITKNVGLHAQLGFGRTTVRQTYFDELFILSNNGYYTIPDYSEKITTLKFGTLVGLSKTINGKFDYDVNRERFSLGFGVKF